MNLPNNVNATAKAKATSNPSTIRFLDLLTLDFAAILETDRLNCYLKIEPDFPKSKP